MEHSASVPAVDTLARPAATVLAVGWVGVLIGLGFVTAAAQMVDHPVIMGRLAPLFWAAPVWTVLSATRQRPKALWFSALSAAGLVVGGALDLAKRHPVAGRYELWLAGAAVLVTVAAWLARSPEGVREA
jgi:hypothetical protein